MASTEGVNVTEEVRPLPIYLPDATEEDLARLKEVYVSLGIPGKVRPVAAVPGSPGPLLAIGYKPYWMCDYALVSGTYSPGLAYAMRCILTDTWDERMKSELDWLNESPLGPGIRFATTMVMGEDGKWKEQQNAGSTS